MPREKALPDAAEENENRIKAIALNAARKDKHITLGIHLSNPVLVRHGRPWKGAEDSMKHPEFVSFVDAVWGYRAAAIHYRDTGVPAQVLVEAGLPGGTTITKDNAVQILLAATRLHHEREAWSTETVQNGVRLANL